MQTLNAFGKHGGELVNFFRSSLKDDGSEADCRNELKILIDGPVQVEEIRRLLEPLGYSDFILEDDDGNLYLLTSKKPPETATVPVAGPVVPAPNPEVKPIKVQAQSVRPVKPVKEFNIQKSTGVLISCENKKYKKNFMLKILSSLVNSKIKPEVLALMNHAVTLAAYNSGSCDYLKELEEGGVKVLISASCADYAGVTEAIGAGTAVDMSEIFEEIFSCERIINF